MTAPNFIIFHINIINIKKYRTGRCTLVQSLPNISFIKISQFHDFKLDSSFEHNIIVAEIRTLLFLLQALEETLASSYYNFKNVAVQKCHSIIVIQPGVASDYSI